MHISSVAKVPGRAYAVCLDADSCAVNRCQTQVQGSVGEPAQASHMEELHQDVKQLGQKVDALERRGSAPEGDEENGYEQADREREGLNGAGYKLHAHEEDDEDGEGAKRETVFAMGSDSEDEDDPRKDRAKDH